MLKNSVSYLKNRFSWGHRGWRHQWGWGWGPRDNIGQHFQGPSRPSDFSLGVTFIVIVVCVYQTLPPLKNFGPKWLLLSLTFSTATALPYSLTPVSLLCTALAGKAISGGPGGRIANFNNKIFEEFLVNLKWFLNTLYDLTNFLLFIFVSWKNLFFQFLSIWRKIKNRMKIMSILGYDHSKLAHNNKN